MKKIMVAISLVAALPCAAYNYNQIRVATYAGADAPAALLSNAKVTALNGNPEKQGVLAKQGSQYIRVYHDGTSGFKGTWSEDSCTVGVTNTSACLENLFGGKLSKIGHDGSLLQQKLSGISKAASSAADLATKLGF